MEQMKTRQPVVAGMFYPADPQTLERDLQRFMPETEDQHDLLGCIAPHAGYMYSGAVAGRLYSHLRLPRRVVIVGPNHTGMGRPVSLAPGGAWSTPLGRERIDTDLASLVREEFPRAELDSGAHRREHSIEVQIPFLQLKRPDLAVLPICLQHLTIDDCLELGRALAKAVERTGEPVGIVASSDMSHYEPDEVAREHDQQAIDAALTLDPVELYRTVHDHRISMCGIIPATVMVECVRHLGATSAHLVGYATSGDASGDRSAVVGYAGICIHRED